MLVGINLRSPKTLNIQLALCYTYAMLCTIGEAFMRNLNIAAKARTAAEKALSDPNLTVKECDALFHSAQKNSQAAATAFLDHKSGCSICRTPESEIRRRPALHPQP